MYLKNLNVCSWKSLKRTKNQKIHIGQPIPFDRERFLGEMRELMNVAYNEDEYGVYEKVQQMVTTFHPTTVPEKPAQTAQAVSV